MKTWPLWAVKVGQRKKVRRTHPVLRYLSWLVLRSTTKLYRKRGTKLDFALLSNIKMQKCKYYLWHLKLPTIQQNPINCNESKLIFSTALPNMNLWISKRMKNELFSRKRKKPSPNDILAKDQSALKALEYSHQSVISRQLKQVIKCKIFCWAFLLQLSLPVLWISRSLRGSYEEALPRLGKNAHIFT